MTEYSNTYINGRQLTWKEAAEYYFERAQHEGRLASILGDLDRCVHGRHEGDQCGSCGGPSHGNPHLPKIIGYNLSGDPIVMPKEISERRNPDAWYVPKPQ